jgi:hypothetical protein
MVFPNLDPNNPPEGFERFIRNVAPIPGIFDKRILTEYKKVDGVYQDVYTIQPMSQVEKQEKLQSLRDSFPFKTWTLNEVTGDWIPPKPYPNIEGKYFIWNDNQMDWIEVENPPQTEG